MPGLTDTRAQLARANEEIARLRERLASGDNLATEETSNAAERIEALEAKVGRERDRAEHAEDRVAALQEDLTAAHARIAELEAREVPGSAQSVERASLEGVASVPDYASMTMPTLRQLLTDRGLSTTGTKPELVARLQEIDRS